MFSKLLLLGGVIFPTITNSMLIWTLFIGPLNQLMAETFVFLTYTKLNWMMLAILEMIGIKVLTIKIWKSIPPINEDFFDRFLARANALISSFFGLVTIMANTNQLRDQYLLMDNVELKSNDDTKTVNYELTKHFFIFTALSMLVMVGTI